MVTVKCPNCDEQFQVVIPEEMKTQTEEATTESSDAKLQTQVISWETVDSPSNPYTGNPDIPSGITEQQVEAEVQINGSPISISVWYTPHSSEWEYFKYVVRGAVDSTQKSLNVYDGPGGLFVKNRGTPWSTEKQWTYLSPEQLNRRSQIADLGDVIEDDEGEGGYGLLLDTSERPLITNGELDKEFVVTLTEALWVMKAPENPVA